MNGLTRSEVAKLLGKSVSTVRRMEGTQLHPVVDEQGVHRFDPTEVDMVADIVEPKRPNGATRANGPQSAWFWEEMEERREARRNEERQREEDERYYRRREEERQERARAEERRRELAREREERAREREREELAAEVARLRCEILDEIDGMSRRELRIAAKDPEFTRVLRDLFDS